MSSIETNFSEGSLLRRTLFTVVTMVGAVSLLLGALSLVILFVVRQVADAAPTTSAVDATGASESAAKVAGPTGGAATLKRPVGSKNSMQFGHEI